MSLKCACGNETNEADGICRVCKLFGTENKQVKVEVKEKRKNSKGGKDMAAATGVKKCEKCGNEYKPTSNAQKYCANCKKGINLEKTKIRKRTKSATPAAKILPPPVIEVRERCAPVILRSKTPHLSLRGTESRSNLGSGQAPQSHIIDALIKQRDEHRQALLELEAILNGISKYIGGVVIPE